MSFRKEWKRNQINRELLNEEVYIFIEDTLKAYKTKPLADSYNDARLITRELVDNIYVHNTALTIIVTLSISNHELTIGIFHDGGEFDPFDPSNKCDLLKARDQEYKFNTTFKPNQNGNYELILKIDLSHIVDTGASDGH